MQQESGVQEYRGVPCPWGGLPMHQHHAQSSHSNPMLCDHEPPFLQIGYSSLYFPFLYLIKVRLKREL